MSLILWSWRESNPRPNEETIRFLHAYLGFDFRATARPKPPTATLSPESHPDIGACLNYSRFTCAADSRRFGTTSLERRLVPSPGDGIKLKIYYTSIKQRERNCFRQLIWWPLIFRSKQPTLRVLTYHFYPLTNPVNPIIVPSGINHEKRNGLQR